MKEIGGKNLQNIKKEIFLNAIVCPTLGWLMRSRHVSKTLTLGEKFLMEQGLEIGRRARELCQEGVLIDDPDMASAAKKTKDLIGDSDISRASNSQRSS